METQKSRDKMSHEEFGAMYMGAFDRQNEAEFTRDQVLKIMRVIRNMQNDIHGIEAKLLMMNKGATNE